MAGYIGQQPALQALQTREQFIATASQTTFNTTGYQVGYLDVFMNGVKLINGTDFTATNSSDVVLASGAAVNDTLDIVMYNPVGLVSQDFTGDVDIAGVLTTDGMTTSADVNFGDNDKAIFGAGSDLQIYHDGSNSVIRDAGTGNLKLQAGNFELTNGDGTQSIITGVVGGAVRVYHNNSPKIATTATGIDVTGNANFADNGKAIFGSGNDLSIFHNGSSSFIEDNGTGGITLRSDIFTVQNAAGTETVAQFVQDGFVKLFHNNSQVFTTTSSGASITGSLGIGTSTPRTGLHLYGAGQTTSDISDAGSLGAFLRVSDTGAAGGAGGGVVFGTNASEADGFAGFAAIKGLLSNGNDRTIGALAFSMRAATTDTALSERMRLTSDGKLGIGTTADQQSSAVNEGIWFSPGSNSSFSANSTPLIINRMGTGGNDRANITLHNNGTARADIGTLGASNGMYVAVGGSEAMRIDSSGNVGIGRTPRTRLEIASGNSGGDAGLDAPVFRITNTTLASDWDSGDVNGKIEFYSDDESGNAPYDTAFIQSEADFNNGTLPSGALVFGTATYNAVGGAVERMRIDSGGNVLVGTTNEQPASTSGVEGFSVYAGGQVQASKSGATVARFNRNTSYGDIVQFRKDGTTEGGISAQGSGMVFYSSSVYTGIGGSATNPYYWLYSGAIYPTVDNSRDLGTVGNRFDDVYATNPTINTSDRNEKQDIEVLSDAETRVAVACKGLMRKFRWKDAVEKKGDDARIHFGIIAQDLQAAFAAEGLDAGDYAMFISTTWWETTETSTDEETGEEKARTITYETQEEAPEGAIERTRLGVRYTELLAFIIGAL
jgi:hypothetical protein